MHKYFFSLSSPPLRLGCFFDSPNTNETSSLIRIFTFPRFDLLSLPPLRPFPNEDDCREEEEDEA